MVTEPEDASPGRARLPAGALLTSLSVLTGLAIGGVSYQQSRGLIIQSQERAQNALAQGLVVALSDQLVLNDYAGMESRLQQAMADPSLASAVVTDPGGKVLVHLAREQPEAEPTLVFAPLRMPPPAEGQARRSRSGPISTRWSRIEAGTVPIGWLQLRTWATSTDAVLALLARQYLVLGALAAALLSTLVVSAQQQIRRQGRRREQRLLLQTADLKQKALSDPLTGVLNRRGVEQELQRILEQPAGEERRPVAVCMIDLDDFKPVNDTYGHAVGDQVLLAVTQRLRGFLRADDLLGRLGGDEFVAIFCGCGDPAVSRKLGTRIVKGLETPIRLEQLQVRIGASIGIALHGAESREPMAALLQRADAAMYAAKHGGKGHLVIAPPEA